METRDRSDELFVKLYLEHKDYLYNSIRKHFRNKPNEIEDYVQYGIYNCYKKFKDLDDISKFKSWSNVVVFNEAYKFSKKTRATHHNLTFITDLINKTTMKNRENMTEADFWGTLLPDNNTAYHKMESLERLKMISNLKKEISKLPNKQKIIMKEVFKTGKDLVSIAKKKKWNYNSVKTNYRYAFFNLKTAMEKYV